MTFAYTIDLGRLYGAGTAFECCYYSVIISMSALRRSCGLPPEVWKLIEQLILTFSDDPLLAVPEV